MMPPRYYKNPTALVVNDMKLSHFGFSAIIRLFFVSLDLELSRTGFKLLREIDIDVIISLQCVFPLLDFKPCETQYYSKTGINLQRNLIICSFVSSFNPPITIEHALFCRHK